MEPYGILVLHKEEGMTSHTAVAKVKRLFGAKKAGHTGTLDPMATGVLPILLGRAVKASEYMLTGDKHYLAKMTLGITTDTEDITGKVLSESPLRPSEAEVKAAAESFLGDSLQTPPMYSAIQVGGVRLMDLARQGKEVEREPRPIHIYSLAVEKIDEQTYTLDVVCSKGTYIRTLCADIGAKLGCGATMSGLCRKEAGGFTLNQAVLLSDIEKMTEVERQKLLYLPEDTVFSHYPAYTLPPFFDGLVYRGLTVSVAKLPPLPVANGEKVRLYDKKGFFGIGRRRSQMDLYLEWESNDLASPTPKADGLVCEKVFRLDPPQ